MLVLGIESTCDETACAVVRDGKEILSNVVTSQIDLHSEYGGVVPELACRRHVDLIIPVIDEALRKASITLEQIDLIAVAQGPGLIGALLIGINVAKGLSLALQKPLVGVNHIEAHLYAALMSQEKGVQFPALGVILSGGHTSLVLMHDVGSYSLVGETIDDAIGEAFDKVAKILGLPYPGGPEIEKLARGGDPSLYPLSSGKVKGRPLDFSFSGLKTGVLYKVKGNGANQNTTLIIEESQKKHVAAAFQKAAFDDVLHKTLLAARQNRCSTLVFGGGVTNNQYLRQLFANCGEPLTLLWPSFGLSLDNAAMIAGLGYQTFLKKGVSDPMSMQALTRISF
jgi:N6-L-threonylcarbamoyladenine synthase